MLITGMMVTTFICAIAIQNNYFGGVAWGVLLTMNVGALVYLSRK